MCQCEKVRELDRESEIENERGCKRTVCVREPLIHFENGVTSEWGEERLEPFNADKIVLAKKCNQKLNHGKTHVLHFT